MVATALALAALACPLPAASATRVPISAAGKPENRHTSLRVCGHRLAHGTLHDLEQGYDGTRIVAASAAGNRVAWAEERHRNRQRTQTVTLARVGRTVRVLQRFTVDRRRTRVRGRLSVLLTRRGDLAWSAGTSSGSGLVALKQPDKPVRKLAGFVGTRLALEDGRTLRWRDPGFELEFFDLRPTRCGDRSRYKPFARTERVLLTSALYGRDPYDGTTVIRGCNLATGSDRYLIQNYSDLYLDSTLTFVGLDRTWAVFHQSAYDGGDYSVETLTVVDVATGRTRSSYGTGSPPFPRPTTATVTNRGVAAWIANGTLYALTRAVVTLDQGNLADLHTEGDALVWTHEGATRRVVP